MSLLIFSPTQCILTLLCFLYYLESHLQTSFILVEHSVVILPKKLSFLLSPQSPVVSVGFAKFHPNLVVGGTYSGQIVLWDNRSHRRTPVQRTPLSAAAHTVRPLLHNMLLKARKPKIPLCHWSGDLFYIKIPVSASSLQFKFLYDGPML